MNLKEGPAHRKTLETGNTQKRNTQVYGRPTYLLSMKLKKEKKRNCFQTRSIKNENLNIQSFATAECLEFRKEDNLHYGKFYLSGLRKGQGLTVANSIRRILLYDLQGIGITQAKISSCSKNTSKVYHEFSTISGIRESILDILMNLRLVVWGYKSAETLPINDTVLESVSLEEQRKKQYKGELFLKNILQNSFVSSEQIFSGGPESFILQAKHLNIPKDSGLFIVNPDQYLATLVFREILPLSTEKGSLKKDEIRFLNELEELNSIQIEYIVTDFSSQNQAQPPEFGFPDFLSTEGNFFPIKKVNYSIIEAPQSESSRSYHEFLALAPDENIFLEIWTNGSLHPKEALNQALDYFLILFNELRNSLTGIPIQQSARN